MKYTNSSLVEFTLLSPNHSNGRVHSELNPEGKIDRITIHQVAGNCSIETIGEIFLPTSRQASSTYGVGSDGRIGMYCEEKDRPWTSGNRANDYRAVTIEVANDSVAPEWHVSDAALESVINLCIDICERNGIEKLTFTGKLEGSNLTMHEWFQDTNCPGPYLGGKFPYIVERVNAALGVKHEEDTDNVGNFKEGDIVQVKEGACYHNSSAKIPAWVTDEKWVVSKVEGNRIVIDKSADGKKSICSPVHAKDLVNLTKNPKEEVKKDPKPAVVALRRGDKGDSVKTLQNNLITLGYTEVGEADGSFGPATEKTVKKFQKDNGLVQDGVAGPLTTAALEKKLKEHNEKKPAKKPEAPKFKKGTTVQISNGATYYDGKSKVPSWVINKIWVVMEDSEGDRVVIDKSADGESSINSPINAKYLTEATYTPPKKDAPKVEEKKSDSALEVGDQVKLTSSATKWFTGSTIPSWVKLRTLFVRTKPDAKGTCQVSTVRTGPITGVIEIKYLKKV